jgi:hypothetical protein
MRSDFFYYLLFFVLELPGFFPVPISRSRYREIMEGEDFVGYLPEDIRWSEDSKTVYFTWNPEKEPAEGSCIK